LSYLKKHVKNIKIDINLNLAFTLHQLKIYLNKYIKLNLKENKKSNILDNNEETLLYEEMLK